jgi:dipeptidase E
LSGEVPKTLSENMSKLRLFLFSDHVIPANRGLDEHLMVAAGKSSPSVGWIPAGSRPEQIADFFEARRRAYADLGASDVGLFPLHADFEAARIPWLLSRDIVHLSGGDPFIFLRNLRATGMVAVLREWAQAGGILVGDSAGAMLMTPSLDLARFGHAPVPDDLTNLRALSLVEFQFQPHFGVWGASSNQLNAYANEKQVVVYGAPDGCGLAVMGDKLVQHGDLMRFG